MPQICDMGQTAVLPLRRKACCGFFRPKNPTASAGFEPAILGTRGQHEFIGEVGTPLKFTQDKSRKVLRKSRRSALSLTSALDGGGWSTSRSGSLSSGNQPVPIMHESGWAPRRAERMRKISPPLDSTPDCPVWSDSLYRLAISAHSKDCCTRFKASRV
jgi:hypothetical protein